MKIFNVLFYVLVSFSRISIPLKILNNIKFRTLFKSLNLTKMTKVEIPEKMIIGYANWEQCDEKIVHAVQNGVNVVIWFSINLTKGPDGKPLVTGGPNMDCVAEKVMEIKRLKLNCIHLISIGGWNSPHPSVENSSLETYLNWDNWNRNIAARPEKGFFGFDGFDWDIEGNDDLNSKYNKFSVESLNLMGEFSQYAKSKGGYLVSMAPAESYLDPSKRGFDRDLRHPYPEWNEMNLDFTYHGLNTYAYLLDKFGITSWVIENGQKVSCNTFDFVTIQLYEGYSHAEFNISVLKKSFHEYMLELLKSFKKGWEVDFSNDKELNFPYIKYLSLDPSRIVIGLANGWAGDGKFLLVSPEEVEEAYHLSDKEGFAPRGFAFWNILDEGRVSNKYPGKEIWMAKGLNNFLNIRNASQND